MAKRFVTIVPHAENLELRKDPGQIPYHLHKIYGYNSTLVSYFYSISGGRTSGPLAVPPTDSNTIHKNYPFLESEVPGLKMYFLKNDGRGKFYEKAIYDYLKNNSKQIDVLNLFHFNMDNIFYSFIYKIKNPAGKLYLKLDIDIDYYKSKKHFFNIGMRLAFLKIFFFEHILYPLFFSLTHLISAESEKGLSYFKKRFKIPAHKLILIPNGVDEERIATYTGEIFPDGAKENIIITVGKIGTPQKNNDMLLGALNGLDLKDWKIYFIGEIDPPFMENIRAFYQDNPSSINNVFFTGRIDDPATLYKFYIQSKVFCLTSLSEGFPLSACEGAFFGNYLILTDGIYGFNELTENGHFGKILQAGNISELKIIIQQLINGEVVNEGDCIKMKAYARKNLTWQAIIPQLQKYL
ncbi:MAG: hypothetical protein JWQ66_4434 [Mucilaginibacter sp.]|nr:hypothetical protein [Mucilaginibacter sp.]